MSPAAILRVCLLAMLLGVLCALPPAQAAPSLLVVTEDSSWLAYLDANGNLAGRNVETVRALLIRAGLKSDIQVMPWARAYALAEKRPNTLIFSIARTPEREKRFVWLGVLARMQRTFFRLRDDGSLPPQSLDEVKSCCKVCVGNRDVNEEFLRKAGFEENINFITADRVADCPRLVQSGAAQLLLGDPEQIHSQMRRQRLPADQLQSVLTLPSANDLYLAANPKTDPATLQSLQQAYRNLIDPATGKPRAPRSN
ncbi:transporter substrate-binding domain-containing protein [uncultured Aquitalea sp.]|uniref:substrate-binding periplasmic protein n=1 Tax=uncultured Aquitalea sp. TaxID=540272 RepID=UPI0025D160AA|nr:transporter substrate-binding domain-containing protein [uncultured Aquitalea sp.]